MIFSSSIISCIFSVLYSAWYLADLAYPCVWNSFYNSMTANNTIIFLLKSGLQHKNLIILTVTARSSKIILWYFDLRHWCHVFCLIQNVTWVFQLKLLLVFKLTLGFYYWFWLQYLFSDSYILRINPCKPFLLPSLKLRRLWAGAA